MSVNRPVSIDALRGLQFLQALPPAVLDRIAGLATVRTYAAGQYLFREGAGHGELLIIASGHVALEVRVPTRGDVRILSLGPGDMIAWSALLGDGRMTTSAVAVDDAEVIAIRAVDALALCEADPAFGYCLMQRVADALANRLVATRLQLLDLYGVGSSAVVSTAD